MEQNETHIGTGFFGKLNIFAASKTKKKHRGAIKEQEEQRTDLHNMPREQ